MKHTCLICGEERQLLLFSTADYFSVFRYAVAECRGCAFAETIIPQEEMSPKEIYGTQGVRFGKRLQWLVRGLYALRTRFFRKVPAGNVIDVGCGHGEFLEAMRVRGWDGIGIERDNQEKFLSHEYRDAANLVTFWHSLEHVEHPQAFLHAAREALKSGGMLLIEVPNFASFQSWWAENRWLHLDCPRHRYHFTPSALKRLVEQMGFQVHSISTWSWDVGLWGSLHAWLDHFGEPHFLYRFLQPESRLRMTMKSRVLNSVLTLFLLPMMAPLAFITEIIAAFFKKGGVIRLVAVKP